jgi:hypothetical protein
MIIIHELNIYPQVGGDVLLSVLSNLLNGTSSHGRSDPKRE